MHTGWQYPTMRYRDLTLILLIGAWMLATLPVRWLWANVRGEW